MIYRTIAALAAVFCLFLLGYLVSSNLRYAVQNVVVPSQIKIGAACISRPNEYLVIPYDGEGDRVSAALGKYSLLHRQLLGFSSFKQIMFVNESGDAFNIRPARQFEYRYLDSLKEKLNWMPSIHKNNPYAEIPGSEISTFFFFDMNISFIGKDLAPLEFCKN